MAAAQAARPEEHHDYDDDVRNYYDDYDVRDSDDVQTWQQLRQPDPKNALLAAFLSLHPEAAGWTRGDQSPRISTIQYLLRQQTNPVTLAASRNLYTVTCFLSNLI